MKKLMMFAALLVALASCQSNGKKNEEAVVDNKGAFVESGTHEPDSVG